MMPNRPHPEDPAEPRVGGRTLRTSALAARGRRRRALREGGAWALADIGLPRGRNGRGLRHARERRDDGGWTRPPAGERCLPTCGGNHREQDQQEQESLAFRRHALLLPPRLVAVNKTTVPGHPGLEPPRTNPNLRGPHLRHREYPAVVRKRQQQLFCRPLRCLRAPGGPDSAAAWPGRGIQDRERQPGWDYRRSRNSPAAMRTSP
jgi:hypothetical protein